jgi:hypothetical protein
MHPRNRTVAVACTLVSLLTVSGCTQVSEQVADWLRPPSPAEMSSRIRDQAGRGELHDAIRKGEAFVMKRPEESAEVHMTLSELYLMKGDAIKGMQHMQMAVSKGAPPGRGAMQQTSNPSTPALATPSAPAQVSPGVQANTDGASARILPGGGIEVRAGGAAAKATD